MKGLKSVYRAFNEEIALEGFNRQLKKYTKIRSVFPTDESLRKSLYLSTMKIMEKWTGIYFSTTYNYV